MPAADVFRHRDFRRFWAAETVSEFGTYVTTIALQVLVVVTLSGTATEVGLLNATRWAPYLLFGLVVGALVDRRRRKPVLVTTDLGRGLLLGTVPLLWALDALSLPVLLAVMFGFGVLSLVNDAASQSFLPRLVPRGDLLAANARLDQSSSVARTTGPLLGGGLVGLVGAPLAVLVDAASYLFSGLVVARLRVAETVRSGAVPALRREIADGLRWVYGHRMLAPFAVSTHAWFVVNSMLVTVYVPYALLALHLSPFELGVTLAGAGVGALIGSLVATRLGLRWGAGWTVVACQAAMPVAWAVIALGTGVAALTAGQFLYGLAMGAENANSMGYRQAVTPDELQGRMNTTMRSVNRAMIVVGAPAGGLLADHLGHRPTLWIGVAGFALVPAFLASTPFRTARHT